MLLKMNKPTRTTIHLELTIQLWIKLLDFYKNEKRKFDREKFLVQHPELVNSIWNSMNIDLQLKQFTKGLSDTEVDLMIEALTRDNTFSKNMENQSFEFAVRKLRADLLQRIKDRYAPMYEKSFTSDFRKKFLDEYAQVNSERSNYCPACTDFVNLNLAQIDHYFPKAVYPTLAINPDNLAPLCKDCNSFEVKSQRPPINPDSGSCSYSGCLLDVFIPYDCESIEKIEISFLKQASGYKLKISSKEAQYAKKVANLVALFKLTERWEVYIRTFIAKLEKGIKAKLRKKLERDELRQYLIEYRDRVMAEQSFNYIIECSFINWLLGNQFEAYYNEILLVLEGK